ncbi:flavin reductase family protein [Formosa sp. PL04]|uniref:flavin reductase family protein n=1 Tax=Formosa sp. PL04 TaxID=3081755 RepID=UPI0029814AA4|nr:flavin reductase family protein [Formosa sp. PL04]MDW5287262.1 flavin reductase family protein [Formosa sp. PL04]
MISFEPKDLTTGELYGYLVSAVAPRPIAFASTIDADGNQNLAPFSFFNVFSANPPILVFSPVRRGRDNSVKHTLLNVESTKEVVINVVNYDLVYQMSLSSTEYAKDVNEFDKAGLTMLKSDIVKPCRVGEAPVQFECKVNEIVALGDQGGAGNLVICEVVKIHLAAEILNADKTINQERLDLVSRAGEDYYTRAKMGFFKIPKPSSKLGIGVDNLPEAVKNSMILTGNDLGMLGNIEALPSLEDVHAFIVEQGERYPSIKNVNTLREKHKLAHKFLSYGDVDSAWKVLLT